MRARTVVKTFSFCVKKAMRFQPKCFIMERNAGGSMAKEGFVLKYLLYMLRLLSAVLAEKNDIYL